MMLCGHSGQCHSEKWSLDGRIGWRGGDRVESVVVDTKWDFTARVYNNIYSSFQLADREFSGISLGMRPANEGRLYISITSLIGWAHT